VDKPSTDPLVERPDPAHRIAWYYGGRFMGYLTPDALAEREARYSMNRASNKGERESFHSTFLNR